MRTALLAVVVSSLLLTSGSDLHAPPAAPDTSTGYAIPFRYDPPMVSHVVVYASINGSPPMPFVVDTGGNVSLLLDQPIATKLGLPQEKKPTDLMPGSGDFFAVKLRTFELKGVPKGPNPRIGITVAYTGDLSKFRRATPGLPIAGIIGAPAFGKTAVRFDFAARNLTITVNPTHHAGEDSGAIPLTQMDAGLYLDLHADGGAPEKVRVVTGSPMSGLSAKGIPAASIKDSCRSRQLALDGAILTDKLLLSGVWVGKVHFPLPAVLRVAGVEDDVLGLDVLSRRPFTIDFLNRSLFFDQSQKTAPARVGGWTGIQMEQRGSDFVVTSVAASSPAAGAGAKAGDRIQRVDQTDTRSYPYTTVLRLLEGASGAPAALTVRRDGGTLALRFPRRSEFDEPPRACLAKVS